MIYCAKCGRELYRTRRRRNCSPKTVVAPALTNGEALASSTGSLPVLESEFLIEKWESKAEELEKTAAQYRDSMLALNGSCMEKARAYRACAKDLLRHLEAANVRQPAENVRMSDEPK